MMQTEGTYPNYGVSDACVYDKAKGVVQVINQVPVIPNNPDQLLSALVETPVLAEINADIEFVFYQGGILDS